MTRLLDARTSQNASYGNRISIPLPANTPVAIAELGLDVTGAGENMRVQLSGILSLHFLPLHHLTPLFLFPLLEVISIRLLLTPFTL
ncbi:hypothetical protein GMA19_02622 [Paenibacillus polymyxa E681]|uniref:hypothetical protein n=1 Tax=Paenibacillus polymyxa TaxID=1406 RepID=UPI000CD350F6|nr:hypothetical protein [Paenibacillus polymyxa]ADM70423.2 hypothetical protein PPE_02595 [Paenibacillus polymyxa E681]QNV57452.1 hypothetical protein GE561_02622 [Paenibacillus polymyxa E681]QNV62289.1 hypothetical protein GMA19_02622 [Paenibacillus polymyxa E681]